MKKKLFWLQALYFYEQNYPLAKRIGNFGNKNLDGEKINTVMAHCVWSTEEEVKRMKDNEVFIAHCPASNMNLSSGIAPV